MVKVDFPQTSWRQQNQARRAEAFKKEKQENNGSEFRKLKELKELARYARLGKLKDNSFAVELGGWKHTASEVYRLLTSLTSLTSLTPKNISQKWVFTVLVYIGLCIIKPNFSTVNDRWDCSSYAGMPFQATQNDVPSRLERSYLIAAALRLQ